MYGCGFRFHLHPQPQSQHDEHREIPADESRKRADCEYRVETASGGVVFLRSDEPSERALIKKVRAVDDTETEKSSGAEPREALPFATEKEPAADDAEDRAERNARTSREREEKTRLSA